MTGKKLVMVSVKIEGVRYTKFVYLPSSDKIEVPENKLPLPKWARNGKTYTPGG